jgi:hypothetical protein
MTCLGFESNYTNSQRRLDSVKELGAELIAQQYGRSADVTAKLGELDSMWESVKQLAESRREGLLRVRRLKWKITHST